MENNFIRKTGFKDEITNTNNRVHHAYFHLYNIWTPSRSHTHPTTQGYKELYMVRLIQGEMVSIPKNHWWDTNQGIEQGNSISILKVKANITK